MITCRPTPPKLLSGMGYCSHANSSQACIAFALDPDKPVTFSTAAAATAAATTATIESNKQTLYQSFAKYGEAAWAAEAVGAAVGWNFVFGPSELGPHLPVSPGEDLTFQPALDLHHNLIFREISD